MKHFVVYATRLSPNQSITPEGYLYCENVPIARTGTQQYKGDEIGINDAPNRVFTIHRLPEQVFHPAAIASFNGMPFTNDHPIESVDANNIKRYMQGTVINVRRGEGDFSECLMADIMVYDARTIDLIQSGKVQISCGYECEYTPYGDSYQQTDIRGNHVALVDKGRAGDFVAIRDEDIKLDEETTERSTQRMGDSVLKKPIKLPRRGSTSNLMQSVGLKYFAIDADPEDVDDAIEDMANERMEEKAKDAVVGDYDRLQDENESLRSELEEANRKLSELEGGHEKLQGELKGFAEQEAQESVHQNPKGMEILNAWEKGDDAASTNIEPEAEPSPVFGGNYSASNDDRGPVTPKEKQPWNPITNEGKTAVKGKLGSWKEISNDAAYGAMKQGLASIPDDATRVAACDAFVKLMKVQRANDEAYKQTAQPQTKDSKPVFDEEYWKEHSRKVKESRFRKKEVK